MRVLITRPRDEAEELAREVERRGHDVLIEPLLTIEPLAQAPPSPRGIQAVLLTSANAARALGSDLARLPVYAVGEATGAAARAAGCGEVHVAEGDARSLASLVSLRCPPAGGGLLHLSGEEVREGLAAALEADGFEVRRRIVYRAVAASAFSPDLEAALRQHALDAALFFSPRTAAVFAELARRHRQAGLLAGVDALCLSDAVAQACSALAWRRVVVAQRPERAAILALLEGAGRRC